MKFWIYVICFLPTLILDVLVKEYVSFPNLVYSLFPNVSWDNVPMLSGLTAAVVYVLLYVPPFYISKVWIEHRKGKKETKAEKILARIPRLVGIALGSIVLASALIMLLQIESVWFASFITTFCDVLVVVGFIIALSSVFISQKHKDARTILRLSGSSLFVMGLTIFYLFAKLHNM